MICWILWPSRGKNTHKKFRLKYTVLICYSLVDSVMLTSEDDIASIITLDFFLSLTIFQECINIKSSIDPISRTKLLQMQWRWTWQLMADRLVSNLDECFYIRDFPRTLVPNVQFILISENTIVPHLGTGPNQMWKPEKGTISLFSSDDISAVSLLMPSQCMSQSHGSQSQSQERKRVALDIFSWNINNIKHNKNVNVFD